MSLISIAVSKLKIRFMKSSQVFLIFRFLSITSSTGLLFNWNSYLILIAESDVKYYKA